MSEDKVLVITDKEELYDKCENIEQLFDKYYLPLLDIHYKKIYQLQQENQQLKSKKPIKDLKERNNKLLEQYRLCDIRKVHLEKENQQLKEQMVNLYQEFKLNNVSTATQYQMINMQNEIHIREVSKLKKHIEYLEQQLKQEDEVIDDVIELVNSNPIVFKDENYIDIETITNCEDAEVHFIRDLKNILQRYKGDNR